MLKTTIETITPEWATEIIERHNPRNRNVSESTVAIYATDMKNDRWTLTHQGIALDENDDLIDGQHWLWAVIFAGVPVKMMVTRGIPIQEARNGVMLSPTDNIDHMRIRSTGQQMQFYHGVKSGNNAAAAARGLAMLIYPSSATMRRMSTANSLFIYEMFRKDIDTVIATLENRWRVSYLMSPLALYHHYSDVKALIVCQQFNSLENLHAPIRLFLKYLNNAGGKKDLLKATRIFCYCLQAFDNGEEIKQVKDAEIGREWLVNLSPALARKTREALRPITITLKRHMKV